MSRPNGVEKPSFDLLHHERRTIEQLPSLFQTVSESVFSETELLAWPFGRPSGCVPNATERRRGRVGYDGEAARWRAAGGMSEERTWTRCTPHPRRPTGD